MRRSIQLVLLLALTSLSLMACEQKEDDERTVETLPPITTTTTVVPELFAEWEARPGTVAEFCADIEVMPNFESEIYVKETLVIVFEAHALTRYPPGIIDQGQIAIEGFGRAADKAVALETDVIVESEEGYAVIEEILGVEQAALDASERMRVFTVENCENGLPKSESTIS